VNRSTGATVELDEYPDEGVVYSVEVVEQKKNVDAKPAPKKPAKKPVKKAKPAKK
jgi:hypothetical protein